MSVKNIKISEDEKLVEYRTKKYTAILKIHLE